MIKAIFFDIDGTLVTRQARPLPTTKLALKNLKKQGTIRGIATGRGPGNLIDQLDDLEMDVFVTYNGQYVYTPNEVIYANAFPKELVRRIAQFANAEKRHILFGGASGMDGSSLMRSGQKNWAKRVQRFLPRGRLLKRLGPLFIKLARSSKELDYLALEIINEPIYQCVLICPVEDQAAIESKFPECKLTRSNPYTVDMILKGNSKSTAIKLLAEKLGYNMAETMAFGDSWNDFEMLSEVKIGVAMGNSNADIKQIADYVTASNEHDGIYQALTHYNLLTGETIE